MIESHEEEEIGMCNSSTASEKSDFDSVGQEMAKSMMTVLLPQAVPLLKESSKKKKETFSPCKVFPHVNPRKDGIETSHLLYLPSSGTVDLELLNFSLNMLTFCMRDLTTVVPLLCSFMLMFLFLLLVSFLC